MLWLFASSSACHGQSIIIVITPSPTKTSSIKRRKNSARRTPPLLTCSSVSAMLLHWMKNTQGS
ncbi:hypothetical protein C9021_24375 [Escherichia coli]|nr:hypothetical protein [Escherichia coli]EGO7537318.1 hypothetical protein [Escherichia coli]MCI5428963.1 hypothetical protein [Escherichia coli]TJE69188.1 hypothetical protein C9209_23835 [Escherichia coli]TJE70464.1 hypothetical protein C9212_25185 [Escherichia coli]